MNEDHLIGLLDENGDETPDSLAYREEAKARVKRWKVKDRKVYGYLVKACEANESAMEIILDEENDEIKAKDLLEALQRRFNQGDIVGVVQAKLSAFNSMNIDSKETAESFINRLLAARRELVELGCPYIDKDVFCLGRLKDSLVKDQRFSQVAMTLKANPGILWEEAVRVITALEATSVKGEEKSAVADLTENVRRLKAQIANYQGRL
jgi:hypothetical protein